MDKFISSGELHDMMSEELFNKKSLGALIFLIDAGREFEFIYNNEEGFISCNESKEYVSLWFRKIEQSFESMEMLVENATMNGKRFIEIWTEIEMKCLL